MGLRPPANIPLTQRDWDQWARGTSVTPDPGTVTTDKLANNAVTDPKLRASASASVMGRSEATPGNPHDITSGLDDTFLVRRSGVLNFSGILDTDIPATIARDTEITAAIDALQLLPDPFPVYLTQTEGDARYVRLPLSGSAVYDPPNLADGAGATTTVTCTSAVLGGFASASFSLDLQGITVTAWVSSANTVSVRFQNESGGALDLASGTLAVRVQP